MPAKTLIGKSLCEQQVERVYHECGGEYQKDDGDELLDAGELEVGTAAFSRARYFPFLLVWSKW